MNKQRLLTHKVKTSADSTEPITKTFSYVPQRLWACLLNILADFGFHLLGFSSTEFHRFPSQSAQKTWKQYEKINYVKWKSQNKSKPSKHGKDRELFKTNQWLKMNLCALLFVFVLEKVWGNAKKKQKKRKADQIWKQTQISMHLSKPENQET